MAFRRHKEDHLMTLDTSNITPIGFEGIGDFVSKNRDRIASDLTKYFQTYTGRWFEHCSAHGSPNTFDGNDVAACAALSVPVDGKTLNGLWARLGQLNALLAQSPDRSVTLAAVDTQSAEYKSIHTLYDTIREIPGMGKVLTSKLLASKRPHLVPIRDSYVEALLGSPNEWWAPWKKVVENEALVAEVRKLAEGKVPAGTSTLRIFDVLLWMEGDRQAKRKG
jgi:hypothetical protein